MTTYKISSREDPTKISQYTLIKDNLSSEEVYQEFIYYLDNKTVYNLYCQSTGLFYSLSGWFRPIQSNILWGLDYLIVPSQEEVVATLASDSLFIYNFDTIEIKISRS